MSYSNLFSYRGKTSQTGLAVGARFPKAAIASFEDFTDVAGLLESSALPIAVPVWNSHEGEIRKSSVWEHLLSERGRLIDLWPSPIQFWFISRRAGSEGISRICSVFVAEKQCSEFLKQYKAEFVPYSSTVEALEKFDQDPNLDGALIAPNQVESREGISIISRETANANNFTSFVLLCSRKNAVQVPGKGGVWLTGVSMPTLTRYLTDAQKDFFSHLLDTCEHIDDTPRPLFVFNRVDESASVGILFEGPQLQGTDLLAAEEVDVSAVQVFEEIGTLAHPYAAAVKSLLEDNFPPLLSGDFVKHLARGACFFSCKELGLFTHGYDASTVEPVFRYYVARLFRLIENGAQCTPSQRAFFDKYRSEWLKRDAEFCEFTVV